MINGEVSATSSTLASLTYTPPYLAEKIFTSRAALEGERKQVTVLFADLKGSMELLADRDPEDARRLLDPVLERLMAAVHRYEGTVNQVMGDGIMALFGASVAHEDHAVRACYAALAMQTAMRQYAETVRRSHGLEMQARVGLNSGDVVVRAIRNDLHMDYSAVGQTTHLAARMEQLATPGSIRLTATTLRLVEGLVQVQALGPIPVKGMPEPVEVFELLGASPLRGRLQAAAARGLTRFVGREAELTVVRQRLAQAGAGHGQVVTVVGEAGTGKSRLVYECVHSHVTQGWRILESASVSYGRATPYVPVIDWLRHYAHLDEADDARTIRAKVTDQVLTVDESLQDTLPALLALLDALPDDSSFRQLDPPQRRQRTLTALTRLWLRASQAQPLLLVCEDLQWLDTETQALLDSLVERLPTAPLLLLVNYRPEYQHGWGNKTAYSQLRLDPLPPASADAFLQALLGDDPSLAPLTPLLIARTEGNPLFLEESVRSLVETEVLVGERGAYQLAQALPTLPVPATVHALLAARIDRLPSEAKHVLQTAAVMGTEVPMPLLQAIAALPEAALHPSLAYLQAAEFLYETQLFPERVYTFKHALTHEVAYGSLLVERRRGLHRQIVEALEARAADLLAQPDQLAQHAFRGELWDKAMTYLQQAGAKAMERSAYREAMACFEQALAALRHLEDTRERLAQEIDLHFALRDALMPLGDPARILTLLRAADTLAHTLNDPGRLGWLSVYMSHALWQSGHPAEASQFGQRSLHSGERLGDLPLQVATHYFVGHACYAAGDYGGAEGYLGRVVQLLPQELSRQQRFGLLEFPAVLARSFFGCALAERGMFGAGLARSQEGLRIAEALAQPYSLIYACWALAQVYSLKGDLALAVQLLERSVAQCRDWQITLQGAIMTGFLGAAHARAGRVAEGCALLEQALGAIESMGWRTWYSRLMVHLGEAHLLAHRREDARTWAERALTLARQGGQRGFEAYALCLLGAIAGHGDALDVEAAATHYDQALTLTEELGMRPLQAHCHLGRGTLYVATGQRAQARTALSTAIEMYTSMAMTFWLPQTEAALAQVEGH